MDDLIAQFLDFTGSSDPAVAKQYLEATANDLEYAVTLFMESANHNSASDEQMAQNLQSEAYSDVREADANVHRHETLVDNFAYSRPTDIFGGGTGIFNQRFDEDDRHTRFEELSESDDDVIELDSDGEEPPRSRRRIHRQNRDSELTSTQRRLANLFRPPFDIMEKIDLDSAKILGRQQQKWLLVNIQDSSEFQCQVLNRDFWSNKAVKEKIHQSFVFLQYQHDSPNGTNYVNFYSVESYPHIAVLDPLTGERVYKFEEGKVPDVDSWLEEADSFLSRFSLHPNSTNPVVQHEAKVDPDAMTEEQQIEYAMKQSIGASQDPIVVEPEQTEDVFESIKPKDHEATAEPSTRIQVRFPNGKRLVHKFSLQDKVVHLYEWLKYAVSNEDYGLGATDRFNLSNTSNRAIKLIDSLDSTIEEASLKNASVLLEKE